MDLMRDVLDKQLVGEANEQMGKVDGLVLELRDGAPPRVAFIEVGGVTLARRLKGPLRAALAAAARRWGAMRGEPFRIPWSRVYEVRQTEVVVTLEADETPARAWEHLVRDRIVARIPGSG